MTRSTSPAGSKTQRHRAQCVIMNLSPAVLCGRETLGAAAEGCNDTDWQQSGACVCCVRELRRPTHSLVTRTVLAAPCLLQWINTCSLLLSRCLLRDWAAERGLASAVGPRTVEANCVPVKFVQIHRSWCLCCLLQCCQSLTALRRQLASRLVELTNGSH